MFFELALTFLYFDPRRVFGGRGLLLRASLGFGRSTEISKLFGKAENPRCSPALLCQG